LGVIDKSLASACELVMHLTGDYHPDWRGRRFDGPVNVWIVGRTAELVRQTIQPLLLGQVNAFGTGLIPMDKLDLGTLTDAKRASTPINAFRVLSRNGGYSTVSLKSGEQGREAFQAATLDIVWVDEEIPFDVFNECQVRLLVRNGIMMYSFTPLKGTTEVIQSFSVDGTFVEGDVGSGRYVVRCSMYDVPHLSTEMIDKLAATTPPFLRDARIYGIPSLGAGAIYPVPESDFVIEPQPIPKHWTRCYGMDVGNKTAAVWLAIDPDGGQIWTYAEYYREGAEPSIHAAGIKAKGEWIPGAVDPASNAGSQKDGEKLKELYVELGLDLVNAVNAVEAGLYTIWEMLSTGRLKVFSSCTGLLKDIKGYQRDEKGKVKKENDHRADAWRYAVMTRDIAITQHALNKAFTGRPTARPVF
jgi:phage terminase large subunit-like protein